MKWCFIVVSVFTTNMECGTYGTVWSWIQAGKHSSAFHQEKLEECGKQRMINT